MAVKPTFNPMDNARRPIRRPFPEQDAAVTVKEELASALAPSSDYKIRESDWGPQAQPGHQAAAAQDLTKHEAQRPEPPNGSGPQQSASRSIKTTAPHHMDELKKAMELLTQAGMLVTEKKKIYVKHSYEVEAELHKKFHSMYGVLGYKTVKESINEAIEDWTKKHASEYHRRSR